MLVSQGSQIFGTIDASKSDSESIAEFPQIFEGNYALISMRITRDVTQGRK